MGKAVGKAIGGEKSPADGEKKAEKPAAEKKPAADDPFAP